MRVLSPKLLVIALVAASMSATSVQAQLGQDVAGSGSISATQSTQIKDHIAKHLADLQSEDPDVMKRAKNALTAPLLETNVSVPFRQAYSDALLAADLAKVCKHKNDAVAINALRVAGEVAENQMITLVQDAFTDTRSSVRYAAVFAAGRTFEQMAVPGRAIAATPGKAEELVRSIAKVLNDSKEDTLVVDGASRALLAAAKIEEPRAASTATAALIEVSKGLSKRLSAASADDKAVVESSLRAVQQIGDAFNGSNGSKIDKDARMEAAGLAGELAAWVVRQVAGGKVSLDKNDAARKSYQTALAAAENTILFAVKASGATPPPARLVPAFEQVNREGDAAVIVQMRDWLVANVLAKAPFNLPADRFKLK